MSHEWLRMSRRKMYEKSKGIRFHFYRCLWDRLRKAFYLWISGVYVDHFAKGTHFILRKFSQSTSLQLHEQAGHPNKCSVWYHGSEGSFCISTGDRQTWFLSADLQRLFSKLNSSALKLDAHKVDGSMLKLEGYMSKTYFFLVIILNLLTVYSST